MSQFFVGIDPDVHKSGVATIHNNQITLENLTFFELYTKLAFYKNADQKPIVYIECGFLNNSNWHKKTKATAAINAKIGERTGANFETAKKIIEMCHFLGLPHHAVRPTKTKLNHAAFCKITGIKQRTNQETRDAMMLIFGR